VTVFRFVEQEKANHPVRLLCRTLGVSPSGYYAWRDRGPSEHDLADRDLAVRVREAHDRGRGTYGSPRIHAELREAGHRVGRKRVARLMRKQGLAGVRRRRYVTTTVADRAAAPAPDLVERDFGAPGPDRLWVADITYLPTRAGYCYLAVITDAWSRRVVGWSMATGLHTRLITAALDMALARRNPGPGLVHHSDRGCQYTSYAFRQRLREAGIAASMGSRGDCYDNAMAESFFASLETELLDRTTFRPRADARLAVFDYIEAFYNPRRRHSALDYLSPADFERRYRSSQPITAA
jgi:putative transposase